MQYNLYTVSVTNGSNIVNGALGTKFLSKVTPGNSFKVKGDAVVYQVSSVTSDTQLLLSTPYQGATAVNLQYQVTTDYTPNFGFAEINIGDQDWPTHLTVETLRKIDSVLSYIAGDGLKFQGDWNASTNTPTIPTASTANLGHFYKVTVSGSTAVSGITHWAIGDTVISNGTSWFRIVLPEYSAEEYAVAAAASAATATTKASEASTSATNANSSAATATTKASEASASATTANTAAINANASATTANTAATNASTSAATATTKASEASTSAVNASASATTASTAATTATSAKLAAEAARDQALTAFDNFDDRYLGQKASAPIVDNDGNPLISGALYFNTADIGAGGGMKVYDGTTWVSAYAAVDNTLVALAAVTTAADKLIYATGVDTFSTTTLTSTARSLLDDTTTTAMRTTLGLGTAATTASTDYATAGHAHGNITNTGYLGTTATLPLITGTAGIIQAGSFGSAAGTFCQGNDTRLSDARTPTAHTLDSHSNVTITSNSSGEILKWNGTAWVNNTLAEAGIQAAGSYQSLDATLTALAGVTTAADKLIYATGVDTFSTTTLTSTARSLLDDTSISEMRTTLGLGTAATTPATDYAVAAKGVTNGDSHDHSGGDGAAISLTSAVTGVLPIANGGTGSSTQNFVDLTTDQTVGGYKSFTNTIATAGNLNFTGTGNRITGDFSNATLANRVMFQTSTVNGNTSISALPNGTSTVCVGRFYNNSDPTNAGCAIIGVNVSTAYISSFISGSGTQLPLTLRIASTDHLLLSTNGNIVVKTAAAQADDDGSAKLQTFGGVLERGGSGIGYGAGSGGTVTQATSKSTAVTLNKPTGRITTAADALAAGTAVYFLFYNSLLSVKDTLIVTQTASTSALDYVFNTSVFTGSAIITIRNVSGGSLSQAIDLNFSIIKGAIS